MVVLFGKRLDDLIGINGCFCCDNGGGGGDGVTTRLPKTGMEIDDEVDGEHELELYKVVRGTNSLV